RGGPSFIQRALPNHEPVFRETDSQGAGNRVRSVGPLTSPVHFGRRTARYSLASITYFPSSVTDKADAALCAETLLVTGGTRASECGAAGTRLKTFSRPGSKDATVHTFPVR